MRKSTLSHTKVFLLRVMRFAKLNKPPPPLSFKPPLSIKPPLKGALKNRGLIEDLRYMHVLRPMEICQWWRNISLP